MSYNGKLFFPVFKTYFPKDLNLNDEYAFHVDYRALNFSGSNWALWPLVKWDPSEMNEEPVTYPSPPTSANWFGTDNRGRDVLARLIYGMRYSLGFAILVWFFSYIVGTFLGGLMGYFGKWVDLLGQRWLEIFDSIPFLLLLILVMNLVGVYSFWFITFFVACVSWTGISYFMRAEFLKIKQLSYVDFCKVNGMNPVRIMLRHILPNALTPIITFSPFKISELVILLAYLDYLGFGLPPPTPSWGELLRQAQSHFTTAWWLALYPSLFMFLTLMSLVLIGEGVRNAFDPHKGVTKS